jgi:hypothetical protein
VHDDRVPDAELLRLRADLHYFVGLAADDVLESLLSVETAASLAELDQPDPTAKREA